MEVKFMFVISCILHTWDITHTQYRVSKTINLHLRQVGLWLAAYKYFEVDRRKGDDLSWQHEERVYHKHFPTPGLRNLYAIVSENCQKDAYSCTRYLSQQSEFSYTLYYIMYRQEPYESTPPYEPFKNHLELFRFRTTAYYYMCWYAMQRSEIMRNFMEGQNCLLDLDKILERRWVDYTVVDFRKDSPENPFLCATILFCPDPCYGRKTEGSVPSEQDMFNDIGNPCRHLTDRTCKWDFSKNLDLESLKRNKFNITCNCNGDRPGFEWYSAAELCIDKDECQDINTKCDKGRICENTVGSFECMCPRGQIFDHYLDKCVEHIPLPQHTYARSGKVKAYKQKSALMRLVEYVLGLRKTSGP